MISPAADAARSLDGVRVDGYKGHVTRDEAYRSLVSRLVLQIRMICEEHNIPFLMTFEVSDADSPDASFVTTMIVPENAPYQMHDVADSFIDAIELSQATEEKDAPN